MPFRVSCPDLVLCLFISGGGGGPVPSCPCLAWGRSPPSRRACPGELAVRAVGAARGRPEGGEGHPGLGALPRRTARPWGVRPRPATLWLWVRGPVTNPTARALASWLCALWGRHEGTRGGDASCLVVGRPGLGALLRPTARPSGVAPGPPTHSLPVQRVWEWGPVTNPTARALACWLCPMWGRLEGPRGGGPPCLGVGRPGIGAPRTPVCLSLGRAARARYPLAVGAGLVGVGTRNQPQSASSCDLALRVVGATRGRTGGAPLAWGWSLSPARPPVLRACGWGPLPTGCRCGGCGRGDP